MREAWGPPFRSHSPRPAPAWAAGFRAPAPPTRRAVRWNQRQHHGSAQTEATGSAGPRGSLAAEIRREAGRWGSGAPGGGQASAPAGASRTGVPSADKRDGERGCRAGGGKFAPPVIGRRFINRLLSPGTESIHRTPGGSENFASLHRRGWGGGRGGERRAF